MPKTSVIVPNYNHSRYLDQRLGSIIDQTNADLEIIFLDDASTDASISVLRRFESDSRVRPPFINLLNSGSPFKQWNKGIREARGEYIWIAESDDYADARFLARLAACLDENPAVGLAYCQSWLVDEHGTVCGDNRGYTADIDSTRWTRDYVNAGRDECAHYLALRNTIPNASAVLFRRSVFDAAGGADESMRLSGDWLTWCKMLMLSDVAFVAEPLNYFRTHPGTQRARRELLARENPRVIDYVLSHAKVPDNIRRLARREVSRLHMSEVFAGVEQKNDSLIDTHLWQGLRYDRSWLMNRGVIAILARSMRRGILRNKFVHDVQAR